MPSSTILNRYAVCFALALFQAGDAAAEEVWKCAFTKSRVQMGQRDVAYSGGGAFFLHIKPPVIDIVVYGAAIQRSFVPISYSVTENSPSRLAGIVKFNLAGGVTSIGEITLEKRSGLIRQSGHLSDKSKSEVFDGACSKSSIHYLPSGGSAPPASTNEGRPSSQPETPVRPPPLVRKRPA